MRDYIIVTDSGSDISVETLKEWGVERRSLTFRFDSDDVEYTDESMPFTDFYARMRGGDVAKTAAVNTEVFSLLFENIVKSGKDVLYIGFSTGLSTTYNSARIAIQDLSEKYPEAKLVAVDSLAASAGLGLLVSLVRDKKNEGATIEEAAKYAEELKLKVCHWFTVDDLVYLKRGGRVSPTAAFFGNMLGIKPVMHVDNDGHLIPVAKVRGRRASIMAMADRYSELAKNPSSCRVFISHGDCIADAELLAGELKKRHGVEVEFVTYVGTVIGAHSGPGTLALFFVGKER